MKINIHDFIRLVLKAKNETTGIVVSFPMIHILIEKSGNRYVSTCLEYSQAFDSETAVDSVTGLIQSMYEYFFSVLFEQGREALYTQARNPENNYLWDEIREYSARKNDSDLKYIELSLSGEADKLGNELTEKVKSSGESSSLLEEQQAVIITQQDFINEILDQLSIVSEENRKLKYGLEGSDEWKEEIGEITRSSLLT